MLPMGSSSRRLLNQSTHSSVANSTASNDRHGPRRWKTRWAVGGSYDQALNSREWSKFALPRTSLAWRLNGKRTANRQLFPAIFADTRRRRSSAPGRGPRARPGMPRPPPTARRGSCADEALGAFSKRGSHPSIAQSCAPQQQRPGGRAPPSASVSRRASRGRSRGSPGAL
jgi:hypothetical protein